MDLSSLPDAELDRLLQQNAPSQQKPLGELSDAELDALIEKTPPSSIGERISQRWNDPNKGLSTLGIIKSLVGGATLPGDVYAGRADPMQSTDRVMELATIPVTGGLGLGLFGAPALGSGMMRSTAPKAAPPVVEPAANKLVTDAAEIGVQIPKAIASDNMMTQRAGTFLSNVPGVGNPLVKAKDQTIEQLGAVPARIEKQLGSGNARTAGEAAGEGIQNWITKTAKEEEGAAYAAVRELVDQEKSSPLTNTTKTLDEINLRRANAARPESPAGGMLMEGITRPQGMNVQGITDLRSSFGPKVTRDLVAKGLDEAEVKQLYGALTKDLQAGILNAGGEKALTAWKEANSLVRLNRAQRDALYKIIGRDGQAAPNSVFEKLTAMARDGARGDLKKLNLAKNTMGQRAWSEYTSGVVSTLGRDSKGEWSPAIFSTAWNKLANESKSVLFKPEHQRSLDLVNNVSKELVEQYKKFGNPSGTSQNTNILGALTFGAAGGMIPALAGALGGYVIARALAEPASAKAIANFSVAVRGASRANNQQATQMLTSAARSLANTLAQASGQDSGSIFRQLQTIVPGRSEEQKRN